MTRRSSAGPKAARNRGPASPSPRQAGAPWAAASGAYCSAHLLRPVARPRLRGGHGGARRLATGGRHQRRLHSRSPREGDQPGASALFWLRSDAVYDKIAPEHTGIQAETDQHQQVRGTRAPASPGVRGWKPTETCRMVVVVARPGRLVRARIRAGRHPLARSGPHWSPRARVRASPPYSRCRRRSSSCPVAESASCWGGAGPRPGRDRRRRPRRLRPRRGPRPHPSSRPPLSTRRAAPRSLAWSRSPSNTPSR